MNQDQNEGRSSDLGHFIWLSDIHYDPHYGTEKALNGKKCEQANLVHGRVDCDSPFALMDLVFEKIADLLTDEDGKKKIVDFMIITGDLSRHDTEDLDNPLPDLKEILKNVSHHLRDRVDREWNHSLPIVADIGNNDITPDYYMDVTNPSEMLQLVTEGYQELLWPSNHSPDSQEEERSNFLKGGYFARNVTEKVTVISLNTNVYSLFHSPAYQNSDSQSNSPFPDPFGQLAWLERQLEIAQNSRRKVYIIGHIPPAMGTFQHSQLWQPYFLKKYYAVLSKFHRVNTNQDDLIRGQFFGHLHSDEFRLVYDDLNGDGTSNDQEWPLLITSSVTPIYGANPSVRRLVYNRTDGQLVDYETFYIDLGDPVIDEGSEGGRAADPEWIRDVSFTDSYQVPDMSYNSLKGLMETLRESTSDADSRTWQTFFSRHHAQFEDGKDTCVDQECRRGFLCALTTTTIEEYDDCMYNTLETNPNVNGGQMNNTTVASPSGNAILTYLETVVLVVVAAVLGASFVFWFQRYLRRRHYKQQVNDQEDPSNQELEDPDPSQTLPPELA